MVTPAKKFGGSMFCDQPLSMHSGGFALSI